MLLRPLEIALHFSCNRINVVGLVHLGIGTGYFLYGARLSCFVWTLLRIYQAGNRSEHQWLTKLL